MSKKLKMPEKGLFGLPSSVRQTNHEENSSTQVLESLGTEEPERLSNQELKNSSIGVLENFDTLASKNPSTEESKNLSTEVLGKSDTEVPNNSSTQVFENPGTEIPKGLGAEELENYDTQVPKAYGTEDSENLSTQVLPKTQKNNRAKDEKKPVRKQASVHLSGATLKALHLFAYEEGLEKSEVVERALREFISKKYFE
jgi:hypothetical protein